MIFPKTNKVIRSFEIALENAIRDIYLPHKKTGRLDKSIDVKVLYVNDDINLTIEMEDYGEWFKSDEMDVNTFRKWIKSREAVLLEPKTLNGIVDTYLEKLANAYIDDLLESIVE